MSFSGGVVDVAETCHRADQTGSANECDQPSCPSQPPHPPPALPSGETRDYTRTPPDTQLHQQISFLTLQPVKDRAASACRLLSFN